MKRLFSYMYNTSAMAFSVAAVLLIIAIIWAMRKFDEVFNGPDV